MSTVKAQNKVTEQAFMVNAGASVLMVDHADGIVGVSLGANYRFESPFVIGINYQTQKKDHKEDREEEKYNTISLNLGYNLTRNNKLIDLIPYMGLAYVHVKATSYGNYDTSDNKSDKDNVTEVIYGLRLNVNLKNNLFVYTDVNSWKDKDANKNDYRVSSISVGIGYRF